MKQIKTKVRSNVQQASACWKLILDEAKEIARCIEPGQFVHLRISDAMDPFFRRPFTVFKAIDIGGIRQGLEIVYKVVGRGTEIMTNLKPGDEIDVIGPCGHGFLIENNDRGQVLVAGGIGATSLYLLARQISRKTGNGANLYLFLGAENRDGLFFTDEFQQIGNHLMVSTDDGSLGYHGTITGLLEKSLESGEIPAQSALYACGPEPMYRALIPICKRFNLSAQISIERRMGCAVGVCLSCICKVNKEEVSMRRELSDSHMQFDETSGFGYALACMDGPVFNLEEVVFDESS